jgi:RND family efflux transporter MFP subunit
MKIPRIKINFKSKKFWIISIIIVLLILIVFSVLTGKSKTPKYETAKVERSNLVQTVDATGNLGSTNDLSLYFVSSGIIQNVKVEEGDKVKAGQWLANLSLSQLNAAVDQAQASLDQKLAGATDEQIAVSEKQVESAQVSLDQANKTLVDTTSLAGKNMTAKYDAAQNSLADAYIKMYNAYTTVDLIAKNYFSGNDQEGLTVRYNESYAIKTPKDKAQAAIDAAKASNSDDDIDSAISQAVSSLNSILSGLTVIRSTCDSTSYQNLVTATDKASIDSQKSYISSAQTAVSQLQNDISILKTQNANNINSAQSGVESAQVNLDLQKANYNSLIAKPRDVDVAYYEAALKQALAARNNAIIYAPIDGIITKANKKVGELVSASEPMIEMSSPNYQIEVDIPETDVVKIKLGDEATVTFDALGSDTKFSGKVLSIDPASTNIQDVVYYQVKVGLEDSGSTSLLKPGMTADVLVKTDTRDNAIFVQSQAILSKSDTDEKYVRVLKNGKIEERPVVIGLKADDGKTEIVSGLSDGEEIILKTAQ